jgi:hypothetical protein
VLLDQYFCDAGLFVAFGAAAGHVFAMDKHHYVGILFDRARVAKVREARATAALLNGARELREGKHGHIQLTCEVS